MLSEDKTAGHSACLGTVHLHSSPTGEAFVRQKTDKLHGVLAPAKSLRYMELALYSYNYSYNKLLE